MQRALCAPATTCLDISHVDKRSIAALDQVSSTVEAANEQTTGNRLKFKLEFMFMLLNCGRTEEAGKMYNQLIEEFDKLA